MEKNNNITLISPEETQHILNILPLSSLRSLVQYLIDHKQLARLQEPFILGGNQSLENFGYITKLHHGVE